MGRLATLSTRSDCLLTACEGRQTDYPEAPTQHRVYAPREITRLAEQAHSALNCIHSGPTPDRLIRHVCVLCPRTPVGCGHSHPHLKKRA